MSDYGAYDEPRRYKTHRTRLREPDEPEYVEEVVYVERGKGPPPRELVYRPREREDSVEEVPREFPPPDARRPRAYNDYGAPPPRRARSAASRRAPDSDDSDDYAPPVAGAAAGAAAGYAASRARKGPKSERGGGKSSKAGRRDRERESTYYYSSEEYSPPRRRERKKSGVEGALEAVGLGGVAGALTGRRSRSQSRGGKSRRGDSGSRSRSPKKSSKDKKQRQLLQAAQAALVAGAVEAFRIRGEPGPWKGEKLKRIATAAVGAGGIDALVDKDPDKKGKRHIVEAVIGGLAANRLANGPSDRVNEGEGRGRSRSRSRSRSVLSRFRSKSRRRSISSEGARGRSDDGGGKFSGLKDVVAGGALAAAGKAIYDNVRSKSRKRSPSNSSEDSYVPARRHRKRDVGGPPYAQSRGSPDDTAVVARQPPPRGRSRSAAPRGGGSRRGSPQEKKEKKGSGSDAASSSESTVEMEEKRKKLRGKEFITAGLASVATIHAAHSVYQSMEASTNRHKLVAEGEMTPEEARKKRSKAWLQDAAAVGIAALGIKGAYSEWKEMNEQRHTIKELEEKRKKRQKRRDQRLKQILDNQEDVLEGRRRPTGQPQPPPDGYGPYASGGLPPPPMGGSGGGYR